MTMTDPCASKCCSGIWSFYAPCCCVADHECLFNFSGESRNACAQKRSVKRSEWLLLSLSMQAERAAPTGKTDRPKKTLLATSTLQSNQVGAPGYETRYIPAEPDMTDVPTVQVIAEGYTTANMFVRPHVLMCLVLYKIVDPSPDIRSEALHVLGVMSVRLWHVPPSDGKPPRPGKALPGGGGALPASNQPKGRSERVAVVIGNVQDAYQQFQYQLSMKLAKYVYTSACACSELLQAVWSSPGWVALTGWSSLGAPLTLVSSLPFPLFDEQPRLISSIMKPLHAAGCSKCIQPWQHAAHSM